MSYFFVRKRIFVFIWLILASIAGIAQTPNFIVVIDAGHGGHDPGAVGSFAYEKDINLAVSLAFGKKIKENDPLTKVIFTRDTDKFLTLQERADIPNNAHADLFVCIHTNSSTNSAPYGSETYTLGLAKSKSNLNVAMRENSVMLLEDNYKTKYKGFDPKSVDSYIMFEFIQDKYLDKSVQFADEVQRNFENKGRVNKGVRQAGFWVLHKTAAPSVLIELGYISNKNEEIFLASDEGQEEMADAIYNAFVKFKRDYQRKSGKDVPVVASNKPVKPEEPKNDLAKPNTLPTTTVQPTNEQTPAKEVKTTPSQAVAPVKTADSIAEKPKESTPTVKPPIKKVEDKPIAAASTTKDPAVQPKDKPVIKEQVPVKDKTTKDPTVQPKTKPVVVKEQVPVKTADSIVEKTKETLTTKQPKVNDKPIASAKEQTTVKPTKTQQVNSFLQTNKDEIIFTIQLFALGKKLPKNSPEFNGLETSFFQDGSGTYKYIYGKSTSYEEIQKLKASIADKFPESWIIALRNGERIPLSEALKK